MLEYRYAIRLAMTQKSSAQAPPASQFSIAEKSDLRQAFYFGLEMDLSALIQPKDIKIFESLLIYDGISRWNWKGEDQGVFFEDDVLMGYPSPIIEFELSGPIDLDELIKCVEGSCYALVPNFLSENKEHYTYEALRDTITILERDELSNIKSRLAEEKILALNHFAYRDAINRFIRCNEIGIPEIPGLNVGMTIEHSQFGVGVILGLESSGNSVNALIRFNSGEKKIDVDWLKSNGMTSSSGSGKPTESKLLTIPRIKRFKAIEIGDQIWMSENLKTERFRNGDLIPEANTEEEWSTANQNKEPAWCYYENKSSNGDKYGKLYNWYALHDPRGLAPEGWHVPNVREWNDLLKYLGGTAFPELGANKKLVKGIKSSHSWRPSKWKIRGKNNNGSNKTGWSGVPGGFRLEDGDFRSLGDTGFWWSSDGADTSAWAARLDDDFRCSRNEGINGCSVRCVKDSSRKGGFIGLDLSGWIFNVGVHQVAESVFTELEEVIKKEFMVIDLPDEGYLEGKVEQIMKAESIFDLASGANETQIDGFCGVNLEDCYANIHVYNEGSTSQAEYQMNERGGWGLDTLDVDDLTLPAGQTFNVDADQVCKSAVVNENEIKDRLFFVCESLKGRLDEFILFPEKEFDIRKLRPVITRYSYDMVLVTGLAYDGQELIREGGGKDLNGAGYVYYSIAEPPNSEKSSDFKSILIGNQTWMAENLNTIQFRNGDLIPEIKSAMDWKKAGEEGRPAWCYHSNKLKHRKKFGKLYNWHAVTDPRGLAPEGWHIPSAMEWKQLAEYLGGEQPAGQKLKSKYFWNKKGNGTDEVGFCALPGGYRHQSGGFGRLYSSSQWWNIDQVDSTFARSYLLDCSSDMLKTEDFFKGAGFYVRCVMNR